MVKIINSGSTTIAKDSHANRFILTVRGKDDGEAVIEVLWNEDAAHQLYADLRRLLGGE